MGQYRKKPVVIDAVQWLKHGDHPAVTALPDGHPIDTHAIDPSAFGWVPTLEGGHVVTPGDWIITGVQGENYPCKPDIFAATYDPVAAPSVCAQPSDEPTLSDDEFLSSLDSNGIACDPGVALAIKELLDRSRPAAAAMTDATERSPNDYAIEYAEYMAKGAERLLQVLNAEDALRLRRAESDDVDEDDMHDAETTRSGAMSDLRSDIYEFRKRRDRAAASAPAPAPDGWNKGGV